MRVEKKNKKGQDVGYQEEEKRGGKAGQTVTA